MLLLFLAALVSQEITELPFNAPPPPEDCRTEAMCAEAEAIVKPPVPEPDAGPASPLDEPNIARCRVEYGGENPEIGGPRSLRATCSADAEEADLLQATADAALERVSVRGIDRHQYVELARDIRFRFDPDTRSYSAIPGQDFIRGIPAIPPRIMARGDSYACSFGIEVDGDGSPDDHELTCLVEGERRYVFMGDAQRSVRNAIRATRFVPTGESYCHADRYAIEIDGYGPQAYIDQLPRYCEAEE
ncbi:MULTISPECIES: hypothetical protein [Hyphobacterium]|uniref:Uncharacterized protein n=1 Tax=Hyphobacterium vulgare TaxID=1736751 RepID=A0ABV6ZWU3_9PROT